MNEGLQIFLLFAGMNLAILAVISWILHYFVALKSPPVIRAAWTSGLSLIAVMVFIYVFDGFGDSFVEHELQINVGAMLSCGLVFIYWWTDFRRAWISDPENISAGVKLANDDWRVGLLIIGGLIIAASLKVLLRS